MANKSCFQCKDSSTSSLMNGWKFRTGEYAQVCHICYSLYKAGKLCETFHSDEDGWRDCNSCKKLIHCGCVVSLSDYLLHDFGGIVCMDCLRTNPDQAQYLELINAESNPTNVTEPHYDQPRGTDLERQSISMVSESVIVHLFDKLLTASDANCKNGRIVIPKKYVEAYFPQAIDAKWHALNILDTDGKEWDVHIRCWPCRRNLMYVLQGLKDYMISKNFQEGDTVAFYRRESDAKMIMELRKASTNTPTREASI